MFESEYPTGTLVFPMLIQPVLNEIEKIDEPISSDLTKAFSDTYVCNPIRNTEIIQALIEKSGLDINLNSAILRLHSNLPEGKNTGKIDLKEEVKRKAISLKRTLGRIPDEINDHKAFLETIKEIASAIKKFLDAINGLLKLHLHPLKSYLDLEVRKKDFVKFSKNFSNTLKLYFKEGNADRVFASALFLIVKINHIQRIS